VVDALLLVVDEAIKLAVPGLHYALAVPAGDGGRWMDGAALHEAVTTSGCPRYDCRLLHIQTSALKDQIGIMPLA
jgi:hypothetical protein